MASFTPSTLSLTISSLARLSLYCRWIAEVAQNTWIRGLTAFLTASAARTMSFSMQRARPATVQFLMIPAIGLHGLEVAGRGDGEAGLDDVHVEQLELPGDLQLLRRVQRRPGRLLAVAQRRVEDADDRHILLRRCVLGWGHLQLPPFVMVRSR